MQKMALRIKHFITEIEFLLIVCLKVMYGVGNTKITKRSNDDDGDDDGINLLEIMLSKYSNLF